MIVFNQRLPYQNDWVFDGQFLDVVSTNIFERKKGALFQNGAPRMIVDMRFLWTN